MMVLASIFNFTRYFRLLLFLGIAGVGSTDVDADFWGFSTTFLGLFLSDFLGLSDFLEVEIFWGDFFFFIEVLGEDFLLSFLDDCCFLFLGLLVDFPLFFEDFTEVLRFKFFFFADIK